MTQERRAAFFLQHFFAAVFWRIFKGVGTTPAQSVEAAPLESIARAPAGMPPGMPPSLLDELWTECDAEACGLSKLELGEILIGIGGAKSFGQASGAASRQQQAAYFRGLRLADLVLARACAAGHERAWERFVALYEQPLIRAAIAITGSDTGGRDLAGQLYAELYGLSTRDGVRRCPLDSYRGTGSLIGWLRTTLAQRHVDRFRRSHRELPIEDYDAPAADPAEPAEQPAGIALLGKAVAEALQAREPEDRFLLASYYMDRRTLLEIAGVLHVHEATVSRKLHRLTANLRKQVLRNLERDGLSRRAAQEALGADPRDIEIDWKNLLQTPPSSAFPEKAAP